MWTWFINSRAYQWIAYALVAIAGVFFIRKSGSDSQELKQIKLEKKKEEVTKKKVDKANEKINSDPTFINDWLRKSGKFRD